MLEQAAWGHTCFAEYCTVSTLFSLVQFETRLVNAKNIPSGRMLVKQSAALHLMIGNKTATTAAFSYMSGTQSREWGPQVPPDSANTSNFLTVCVYNPTQVRAVRFA